MLINSGLTTEKKAKIRSGSIFGLTAAIAFWLPDIVLHAYSGKSFFGREVLVMTALLPLAVAASLYFLKKIREGQDSSSVAITGSILGMWLTGPIFMTISASFSGGGFSQMGSVFSELSFIVACTALFPLCTFMMSTYDGTLFALLIATAVVALMGRAKKLS